MMGGWVWLEKKTYREEYETTTRETQMANDAFVEHTQQVIGQVDTLLRAVRDYYLQSGSVEQTEAFIAKLSVDPTFIEGIYIVDAEGTVTLPSGHRAKNINAFERDYFRFHIATHDDRIYFSPVRHGEVTGKNQFRVSRRISTADGHFAGVVIIPIEPRALAQHFLRLLVNRENFATLIGIEDQKIRARSPEPQADAWDTPITSSPLWENLAKAPEGSYRGISIHDQVERRVTYQRVGDLPLVMVTGFSNRDVQSRVARQMQPITVAAGATLIVIILLATTLSYIYRQREEMRKQATTDALTGLHNRRYLLEHGDIEIARAQRYGNPLSIILLDIDHFKSINDSWGHPTGDRVLTALADTLAALVRGQDIVGRLGGEEFLVILPETDLVGSESLAERIRSCIEECAATQAEDGSLVRFNVSIGIASLIVGEKTFAELFYRADQALYKAKASGRNCVVAA